MSREIHVRFREGVGGRFLRATRLVVLCRTESQCKEALRRIRVIPGRMGLEMHPEKTRVVDMGWGKGSFVFLGWMVCKKWSIQRNPRWYFMQRWPSPEAIKRIQVRVHEITDARDGQTRTLDELIVKLNPVVRGWGNYFRTGNADREFNKIDRYVRQRVLQWQRRRGGQRTRFRYERWPRERLYGLGLHRLPGTIRYPQVAAPRKICPDSPSASCVRETRTHSLKGGAGNGPR